MKLLTKMVYKPLTIKIKKNSGRNSSGKVTIRHRGGGAKRLYRMVDFKQKIGIPAKIEKIEYDPYRTANIARIVYQDGHRSYILAPKDSKPGQEIICSPEAPIEVGNRTKLSRIPVGSLVFNIELFPGKGGQLCRSAGSSAQVLANQDGYTHLKLPSGEIRKVPWDCFATIGVASNPEHNLRVIRKAGTKRHMGRRPVVRGTAMNPRDHPYGGGEGKTQRGTKYPKTKWGKITGGRKTRKKHKPSDKLIIQRRK